MRRTEYRLAKAAARAHLLQGLLIALDHIDEVIRIIRGSKDVAVAREALMTTLTLSEVQATAILDMQLRRLTALEREKLEVELAELQAEIAGYEAILASPDRRYEVLEAELDDLVSRLGTPRRTRIVSAEDAPRFTAQTAPRSLELGDDPCILTLSTSALVGRELDGGTPPNAKLGRHDVLIAEVHTSNRQPVTAITDLGRAFSLPAFEIPEVAGRGRGAASSELFSVGRGERVLTLLGTPSPEVSAHLLLATTQGLLKRVTAEECLSTKDGAALIGMDSSDRLVAAWWALEGTAAHGGGVRRAEVDAAEVDPEVEIDSSDAFGDGDLVLVTSDARALRTAVAAVSVQGRAARGVLGIKLRPGARVIAAGPAALAAGVVLSCTDGDINKLTSVADIPRQGRASGGVRITRFRGFETMLWFAHVSPSADICCVFGQADDGSKPDGTPRGVDLEVTWRDGIGTKGGRVLAAGKARW